LAGLGDSEVFAVKYTPSHAIPELGQSPEDHCEISSLVGREETRNVFEENNSGATVFNQSRKLVKESRLLPFKPSPRPHSRQRDILARESSCPHIGKRETCSGLDFLDVFVRGEVRPVRFEYGSAVRVDLALETDSESGVLKSTVESSDS